jgi:lambda family phage minor tail protein L
MDQLLNVDLQEQSPSAEETPSGSAIITTYEIVVNNSDIGGAGVDKLYFHDGTKTPSESYADIQMYSPNTELLWGSTDADDYTLKTYTAFPFEFTGYERRTTGSLPRPSITFANINRTFTAYLANYDELIGAKIIRRKTLAKYLGENPPVEFPKEIYYIERKTLENQLQVQFELASNFDVQGITLPTRRVIGTRCPWKYKDATIGGCDWEANSKHDYNVRGKPYLDEKVYLNANNEYIIASETSSSSTFSVWSTDADDSGSTYSKGNYVEYFSPLATDYDIDSATGTTSTSVYTIDETDINITPTALINDSDGITTSDTTIDFDGASSSIIFPTKGVIQIEDEAIKYDNRSSTQFLNCTRAFNSTTAATHANNIQIVGEEHISVRGSTVSAWDHNEVHLKIKTYVESGGDTVITVISPAANGFSSYTGGGILSPTRNTLYKCIRTHTPTIATRPGKSGTTWELGDICSKSITGCKNRFGFNPGGGWSNGISGIRTRKPRGQSSQKGSGYVVIPTLTIGDSWAANTAYSVAPSNPPPPGYGFVAHGNNHYKVTTAGTSNSTPPTHTTGAQTEGAEFTYLGARAKIVVILKSEQITTALPFGGFPGALGYA